MPEFYNGNKNVENKTNSSHHILVPASIHYWCPHFRSDSCRGNTATCNQQGLHYTCGQSGVLKITVLTISIKWKGPHRILSMQQKMGDVEEPPGPCGYPC